MWVSAVVSLAGVGVSAYLTLAHYDTHVRLVCSSKGLINCEQVTTSAQSIVFGIPVALLGLGYFAAMTALNLPVVWKLRNTPVDVVRLTLAIVGIGFALYLVYAELVIINAICLWCSTAHVLAFILFVLVLWASTRMDWWPAATSER